ncbi:coiled-coil 90B-like protein [Actinidia rufa]|nr:coiled-coil 90B-like protein [Actinidia rufa]
MNFIDIANHCPRAPPSIVVQLLKSFLIPILPHLPKLTVNQEHHFSLLQRETEKLRNDIEKMRSELRYEIDKVTAGQRLDLNLERGRIRDELANQNAETTDLTNKLDREIHALRAQLEAAKYDVIKYCIGTLVSISAVGLAVVRILL